MAVPSFQTLQVDEATFGGCLIREWRELPSPRSSSGLVAASLV
ncbi:MAG: hypothetical protein R3C99_00735 [Pirellulaceae bacterium]